ncbi:MAG: T9SS type A sorting domain-containing protein [Calditrichaeota bacterium]|nr:T9SS type A sorting domain-containing protein [Calditrichota bacterium]
MEGTFKRSSLSCISFRVLLSLLIATFVLGSNKLFSDQQESFKIYVVGGDRSFSGQKLQAAGHEVTWEVDALQIKLADLSQFDQVWFVDIFAVPDATGRANLINFIKSGGKLFFVGDSYKEARAPLFNWRDSLFNELGAGGVKQSADVNPSQTIYYTNPFHVTSYTPNTVHYIEHGEGRNGSFENIGNGTVIVGAGLDATGTPIAIAFNYGDLEEAPHSRAIIYLNSNMYTNWDLYVANLAKFLGSKDKTILQARYTSALPGSQGHLKIALHNSRNVSGLQFRLTDIPDAITPLQINSTDRSLYFSTSWEDNHDGSVSIVISSQQGASILPGTGSIADLLYQVNDGVKMGDSCDIDLSDVLISDELNESLLTTLLNGKFYCEVLKGDVIMDGVINVVDLVRIIDIILGRPPEPTQTELDAADYNSDGDVNILDVVAIINNILGREPAGLLKTGNLNLNFQSNEAISGKMTGVIPFFLTKKTPISGAQIQLRFDSKAVKLGNPTLTNRADGMTLVTSRSQDRLSILIFGMDGKLIAPDDEPVFKLPVVVKSRQFDKSAFNIEKMILADGNVAPVEVALAQATDFNLQMLPTAYRLEQNYPNPFNMETEIQYQLPEQTAAKLTIFNVLGRKVVTLVDKEQKAGVHRIYWDGHDANGQIVGTGIYFYRLQTPTFTRARKMTILK